MMTRKHYVAFAEVIRDEYERTTGVDGARAVEEVARGLARVLQSDNPRFDRGRFLEAALGDPWK